MRAETVSGPGGKARFLCAPLLVVNDLFAKNSLFAALSKNAEKTTDYWRARDRRSPRQTFGDRNDPNLPIPLTGIKLREGHESKDFHSPGLAGRGLLRWPV